jgi:hypothetical protein
MRSKESKQANVKQKGEGSHYLPPRKAVHPSEKRKWTAVFYQTLLWLFVLLVVGLTIWGIRAT